MNWKEKIEKSQELLVDYNNLKSQLDGVDRPKPLELDRSKAVDKFAEEISDTALSLESLKVYIPLALNISKIGEKLLKEGKIEVKWGDSLSKETMNYLLKEYGVEPEKE